MERGRRDERHGYRAPAVNAVVVVFGERALDAARKADRAVAAGDSLPPLHRVRFTIKDDTDLADTPTTQGP